MTVSKAVPNGLKLRVMSTSEPDDLSQVTSVKVLDGLLRYYDDMIVFADLSLEDQGKAIHLNKKQKLPEMFKRFAKRQGTSLSFTSRCVLCNTDGGWHTPQCNAGYEAASAKVEIKKRRQLVKTRRTELSEELEKSRRRPRPTVTGDTHGGQQPAVNVELEEWPEDDEEGDAPVQRRSIEAQARDRAVQNRASHHFFKSIAPGLPQMSGMVRRGDAVDKNLHFKYNYPNPHIHGKAHFPNSEGKFKIQETELSATDTILASKEIVVVSPGMFFPCFFDADKFKCPKCGKCAQRDSPFERQGFTYQPRFVYGVGGTEQILFVDVYRHIGCHAAMQNPTTGKFGTCSFSAIHPKMMAQYSAVVRQWYPYRVSQRTIVKNSVSVFNRVARLVGMSISAISKCLGEVANTEKTELENAQLLAEIQVRNRGHTPDTKKTMDDFVTKPASSGGGDTGVYERTIDESACMHIDLYIHTYMHTYIHAYIHTYIHICCSSDAYRLTTHQLLYSLYPSPY
jgi:hypothetical protein